MRGVLAGVVAASLAVLAGRSVPGVSAQAGADKPAFYTEQVRPILESHCGSCHLTTNHRGGLSLATKASTLKGGQDGAVIVPGDPAASLLVQLIRHEGPPDDPKPMPPPPRPKLSDAEIATVTAWIKAGAVMPDDAPAQ